MEPKAFLFDLDLTLVDSSGVSEWRDRQMWADVNANLHRIVPFDGFELAPHEVPGRLKADGYRVAVVTSSPRKYATALLKKFKIAHDVLVAYDDTDLHKPDPAPLQKALAELGVSAAEACHVGDASSDNEAGYHAGVVSIGAAWGVASFEALCSAAPDVLITRPVTLTRLGPLERRTYFAEVLANGDEPKQHPGSVLPCGSEPRCYALGRYFKTEDPRHGKSALAEKILSLKNKDDAAAMFGRSLALFLKRLVGWKPDYIVPVPPKPSQKRNRFEAVLEGAKDGIAKETVPLLDGLRCVKEVEGYKSKSPLERQIAIHGAFASKYTWKNGKVLLLDDVLTTGETVSECVRVLRASEAGEVRVVAFGKDQQAFVRKQCPRCGRAMRVRTGRYGRFWGCSGYGPGTCDYTENFTL